MRRKFEPLDDSVAELIAKIINIITKHEYPLRDNPYDKCMVQDIWRGMWLFNKIAEVSNIENSSTKKSKNRVA